MKTKLSRREELIQFITDNTVDQCRCDRCWELAEKVADKVAEAWDEGYGIGVDDADDYVYGLTPNPYWEE